MSQRASGYERLPDDAYQTPPPVVDALAPLIPKRVRTILEPAPGDGLMVAALRKRGFAVAAGRGDFLQHGVSDKFDAVVTNPPFETATEFIERALADLKPRKGFCAFLTRVDFDSAQGRRHLFEQCPAFALRLVLLRRIRLFAGSKGGPSFNHVWLAWDWHHAGPLIVRYVLPEITR
jgi:hypothetical protein